MKHPRAWKAGIVAVILTMLALAMWAWWLPLGVFNPYLARMERWSRPAVARFQGALKRVRPAPEPRPSSAPRPVPGDQPLPVKKESRKKGVTTRRVIR